MGTHVVALILLPCCRRERGALAEGGVCHHVASGQAASAHGRTSRSYRQSVKVAAVARRRSPRARGPRNDPKQARVHAGGEAVHGRRVARARANAVVRGRVAAAAKPAPARARARVEPARPVEPVRPKRRGRRVPQRSAAPAPAKRRLDPARRPVRVRPALEAAALVVAPAAVAPRPSPPAPAWPVPAQPRSRVGAAAPRPGVMKKTTC